MWISQGSVDRKENTLVGWGMFLTLSPKVCELIFLPIHPSLGNSDSMLHELSTFHLLLMLLLWPYPKPGSHGKTLLPAALSPMSHVLRRVRRQRMSVFSSLFKSFWNPVISKSLCYNHLFPLPSAVIIPDLPITVPNCYSGTRVTDFLPL